MAYTLVSCLMQEFFNSDHATADKSGSGQPDQANTVLTEPNWSGKIYRTEPDYTEPDLTQGVI